MRYNMFFVNIFKCLAAVFNRILLFINRVTISKVIIIFTLGFVSRVLINNIYNVNVFVEYYHIISLFYYTVLSLVIVLVSDLIAYFEFSIIPSFVYDIFVYFGYLVVKCFTFVKVLFSYITKINLDSLKISSIRKALRCFINGSNNDNKMTISSVNSDLNVADKSASLLDVSSVLSMGDDSRYEARMGRRLGRIAGVDSAKTTQIMKASTQLDSNKTVKVVQPQVDGSNSVNASKDIISLGTRIKLRIF